MQSFKHGVSSLRQLLQRAQLRAQLPAQWKLNARRERNYRTEERDHHELTSGYTPGSGLSVLNVSLKWILHIILDRSGGYCRFTDEETWAPLVGGRAHTEKEQWVQRTHCSPRPFAPGPQRTQMTCTLVLLSPLPYVCYWDHHFPGVYTRHPFIWHSPVREFTLPLFPLPTPHQVQVAWHPGFDHISQE